MVVALQTFSKDELQAMDGFYSSTRTGQAILAKMPVLSKSMPGIDAELHAKIHRLGERGHEGGRRRRKMIGRRR